MLISKFRKNGKYKEYVIASETLEFILQVCKSTHPREFGAILEATDNIITDILYLPGTQSTEMSVRFNMAMLPNMKCAGSVHSHPNGAVWPSKQDLIFFRSGNVNIIVGAPYEQDSWKAFDRNGNPIYLRVVDHEFKDDAKHKKII